MDKKTRRILIVDDNPSIHDDIKHVLAPLGDIDQETLSLENELFGDNDQEENFNRFTDYCYELDNAFQGEEAVEKVERAEKEKKPYSLIFMDVRMPPGIDGIQAIKKIWDKYPYIEIVICTAYSDYSWDNIISKLGSTDKLFFMKKPFDTTAVKQIAHSLSKKWENNKLRRERIDELEYEIKKRTDQVENMISYLNRIKEEAEQSKIVKNNFLTNMSYEIYTPLNGLMGMTDMLLDTELSSEQRTYAQSIKISRNSLFSIIDDILSYSKVENDKLELSNIEFNLRSSIENLVDILATAAYEKSLNIAAVIDTSIPETLIGDPLRLKQILLNFINNAIKSTESGSVLLNATCKNIDKSTNSVSICFEVSDTGRGLSEEEKEKLFLPLKAKDSKENNTENQNGKGLCVCKHLCELMNGKINVKSEIGKGSKFQFTTDFIIEPSPGYKKIIPSVSARGLNCLVISDNPVTRKILNLHINQWGVNCSEATNISEAIEKLNTALDIQPYEIVLLDFNDADIRVYKDFINSVRNFRNLECLKLVCLTSKSKRGDAEILGSMGYSAYLTKPIRQRQLYKCLLMLKGLHEGRGRPGHPGIITKYMIDDLGQDCYRALIVSDNPENLQNLLNGIYKLKIRCDLARNSEIAVDAYKNNSYDFVFIDCVCSSFNGMDISKSMNEQKVKHIPIIGITGDSTSENKSYYQKAGMLDIIKEPFEINKIVLILKNSLNQPIESKMLIESNVI